MTIKNVPKNVHFAKVSKKICKKRDSRFLWFSYGNDL